MFAVRSDCCLCVRSACKHTKSKSSSIIESGETERTDWRLQRLRHTIWIFVRVIFSDCMPLYVCDIVFAADGRFYVCFFSLFNSRACSSGGGNGNPWSSSSFIFLMCIIIYSNGDCGIAQHLRWNLIRIWNLLSFFLSSLLHSAPVCGSTPFHCVFIFDSLCMRAAFRGLCVTRHVLRFVSSTAEDDSVGFECVWVCRRDFNLHIN